MKKAISVFFAVVLCLGLCACSGVKKEDFDALAAKVDALAEEHETLKAKLEPYADIIGALEKEDYNAAAEAVDAMRPAPEVTEVEITMDNLWDYFEITENKIEGKDAQGNLYSLYIDRRLSLKEEYTQADQKEYPTDVAVGFEYDFHYKSYWMPVTIDFETWTCNGTAFDIQRLHESKMAHFPTDPWLDRILADANPSYNSAGIQTVENFEILNASGTLYLVNK